MRNLEVSSTESTTLNHNPALETNQPPIPAPDSNIAASATQEQAGAGVRVSWPHVVLSVIGMGLSAYSIYLHNLIKKTGASGCGFTETISCDKVLRSSYGEFLHIPLGAYGFAFFVIVLLTAITTQPLSAERSLRVQRLAVASAGLLTSIALTIISLMVIRAACPICLATHATTFSIFVVSLWGYLKLRNRTSNETQTLP